MKKILRKAVVAVLGAAGSYAAAHSGLAQSWGISVALDPDKITLGLIALIHGGKHILAAKWPKVFGWIG